jgi:hypothetical protein
MSSIVKMKPEERKNDVSDPMGIYKKTLKYDTARNLVKKMVNHRGYNYFWSKVKN